MKNIEDNSSYSAIEFVILDYNSQDGMEEWVREKLLSFIDTGKVVYFKTTEPLKWNPSHSKNLAFKLATGDVICNIWADYFAGKDFAHYVNRLFRNDSNIVLTPIDFHKTKTHYHPPGDVLGKVCVKKSDFFKVNGFDERMDRHGFEDYDFVNRLELLNVKRVLIDDFSYLHFLSHDDEERNIISAKDLEALLVSYIDPSKSDCMLLFKDGLFQRGLLIDNHSVDSSNYKNSFSPKKAMYEFSMGSNWQDGSWTRTEKLIELQYKENNTKEILVSDTNGATYKSNSFQQVFFKLESEDVIVGLLKFKHFHHTRKFMEENLLQKKVIANSNGFGEGTVFKNFQPKAIAI